MENGSDRITIGFLDIVTFSEEKETNYLEKYFGAILITDENSVPLEFRCTHPIKPSEIQKQLYGNMLLPYISINLCGLPLLKSLNIRPSILIVQKESFIEIRDNNDIPLIFIKPSGEILDIQSSSNDGNELFSQVFDIKESQLTPLKLYVKNKYKDDIKTNINNLNSVFSKISPLEPFERIQKAIDMISVQDERFK
jgi:hypothetical protein